MTFMVALVLIAFLGWTQSGSINASIVVCPEVPNSTTGTVPADASCYCVDIDRKKTGTVLEVLRQGNTVLSRLLSNI
jgi:hypothetical protein